MPAAGWRPLPKTYGARIAGIDARIVNCAPVARVYVKIFTSTFRGRGRLVPGKFPDTRSASTWTLSGYADRGPLAAHQLHRPQRVTGHRSLVASCTSSAVNRSLGRDPVAANRAPAPRIPTQIEAKSAVNPPRMVREPRGVPPPPGARACACFSLTMQ